MRTCILLAEASGCTKKQELTTRNNDLNLVQNEVMDALTGVPFIENNCHTMVYVRDGEMFLELVDARTIGFVRQEHGQSEM